MVSSRPRSRRTMSVRCAHGQASETYRWYRPGSALNGVEPSALKRPWIEYSERTNEPFLPGVPVVCERGEVAVAMVTLSCGTSYCLIVKFTPKRPSVLPHPSLQDRPRDKRFAGCTGWKLPHTTLPLGWAV